MVIIDLYFSFILLKHILSTTESCPFKRNPKVQYAGVDDYNVEQKSYDRNLGTTRDYRRSDFQTRADLRADVKSEIDKAMYNLCKNNPNLKC